MNLTPVRTVRCRYFTLLVVALLPLFAALPTLAADKKSDKKQARQARRELQQKFAALTKQFDEELKGALLDRQKTIEEIAATRLPEGVRFIVERVFENPKETSVFKEICTRALGKVGTREGVVALLTDGFTHLPESRHEVVGDSLTKILDPDAIDWIVKKGWRRVSSLGPIAQEQFVRVMAATEDPRAVKGCEKLLGHPQVNLDTQARCVDLLRHFKHKRALSKISKLARVNHIDLNVSVIFAIREMAASEYSGVILDALESQHWQVRSVAVDTLRDTKDPELMPYFVEAMKDKNATVQISAIIALREIGGDDVMDPLIAALETTEGRVRDDVAEALVRLTGEDFGVEPIAWRSWWTGVRGKVKIAGISREAYDDIKKKSDEAATGLYYGLRILSKHVAFVIDASGSMAEKFEFYESEPGSKKRGGRTGVAPDEKKDKRKKIVTTKIAIARKELSKVVSGLRNGTRFNIIRFSGVFRPWQPQLVAMADPVRDEALTYVKSLIPDGETNVYDTLRFALSLEDVDTIYFLSDGAPTAGQTTNPEEILAKINRENEVKKVKIHTIGFHLDPVAEKLMKDLAEQNHGRFVKK
ncbi:MAG: HEAT repeat domain-containing protein [Planctomycetota bacterium]